MNVKKVLGLIVLAVLAIAAIVLGSRMAVLIPQVREEQARTPTPDPTYGNVMVVTPDPDRPTRAPAFKQGMEGEAIGEMQTRLAELGYYTGEIDSQFGPGTRGAVVLFQEQNGLEADGVAGPATLALLYSDEAKVVTITPAPTPTATPAPTDTPAPTAEQAMTRIKPYERPDGLPLVVNRSNLLPDGYETYDLIVMNDYCDSSVVKIKYKNTKAEREAVDALMVMLRAAIDDGIGNWQVSAAYRDTAYQKQLFDKQVKEYMDKNGLSRSRAIEATRKTVADPGSSEHHIGTAFDITVPGVSFKGTKQADWLAENCWDYGFILRYAEDKEKITGFLAEAWHFRYVGVQHSLIMRDQNLCLEEYVDWYGVEWEE